ncbi:hypothetical protein ACOSP7_027691 [Xanthoceras sorbifolium]
MYSMQLFRLPNVFVSDIHRLCARFWWSGDKSKRKIHWRSWDYLCKNKLEGGLGFRNLISFNQALLAKQAWRILHNPKSLVAKVLKGLYFPRVSFTQARVRSASSLIWRSFLWGRELLEKGLRWRVGDGCSISVYRDRWIPKPSTFRLTSCPNLNADAMVRKLISDLGSWNEQLIGNSFHADDAAAILGLPLPMQRQRDMQIWHFNANRAYW